VERRTIFRNRNRARGCMHLGAPIGRSRSIPTRPAGCPCCPRPCQDRSRVSLSTSKLRGIGWRIDRMIRCPQPQPQPQPRPNNLAAVGGHMLPSFSALGREPAVAAAELLGARRNRGRACARSLAPAAENRAPRKRRNQLPEHVYTAKDGRTTNNT